MGLELLFRIPLYDAGGQRVRKVTERQADAGTTPMRKSQIVYLGGFEVYTEYSSDGDMVTLKHERLSVSDGTSRVAIVETLTSGADSPEASSPLIRYQISNSLGSVSIELDDVGRYLVRRIYALWLNLIPNRTEPADASQKISLHWKRP
jgi:hypothetical protein